VHYWSLASLDQELNMLNHAYHAGYTDPWSCGLKSLRHDDLRLTEIGKTGNFELAAPTKITWALTNGHLGLV
jgi:hypothetical protein